MNQEEFEVYKRERLLEVADKSKDIEVALRVHKDWEDINASKIMLTKIRDKVNEMFALYFNIEQMEMSIEEDEPETVQQITFDPYADEDDDGYGGNNGGMDNISDYLG